MSLWAFRFLLWYICVLLVQPQNRFTFLWPLRIANLSFIIAVCLHVMGCLESRRFLIRLGPGTILAFLLLLFATLSQHFGVYQISSAWNSYLDIIVKNKWRCGDRRDKGISQKHRKGAETDSATLRKHPR